MNPDEHFDFDAWMDFARGLGSPRQRTAMQQHADSCAACSETAAFLGQIWNVGRAMPPNTVPEAWSHKAEQILGDHLLQPIRLLPKITAVLTSDSFSTAVPANVRSGLQPARQMMYYAADCALYMQVAEGSVASDVAIVGQIANRRTREAAVANTPVFLTTGNKVLASTSSNEFGEFQLACRPKRKMQISFPFEGSCIEVKLDDLLKEFLNS
jgi:hypothetical protein